MDSITWSERVTALRSTGMTLALIGQYVGLSQQGVCDIEQRRTKEPTGMAAVRLHALHKRRCKRAAV